MMTSKQAKRILKRYHNGTASDAETTLLEQWYLHTVGSRLSTDIPLHDAEREATWAAIQARIESQGRPSLSRRLISQWPYLTAAAVAIAVLSITWLINSNDQSQHPKDILPGGNRATLTLADGRTVDLSSEQSGIIVGTEDITYDDGSALHVISSEAEGRRDISLLELSTPKGGTYQVTLPDGSRVWLNAGSTLKYPIRFNGDSREVILEGEAYFAIRPLAVIPSGVEGSLPNKAATRSSAGARVSRVPFKVQTSGQTVEVLGTEFNISAYPDDPGTKTTLVEGRVRVGVSPLEGGRGVTKELTPGQQSILSPTGIQTRKVDINSELAWKNGLFIFNNTPIKDLMRQISRWYDVEVVYDGDPGDRRFFGKVYRNYKLSQVLALLQELEGNTIIFKLEQAADGQTRLVVKP